MALALTLNGVTTASIPGSPANGDRIAMSNGTIRLSFVWNQHTGANWNCDLIEYSPDGSAWTSLLYAKDSPRGNNATWGEFQATNGALSIITNTASALTLQLLGTVTTHTVLVTFTIQFKMTTSQPNLEVSQSMSVGSQVALGANIALEDYGACWWTPGLPSSVVAMFDGISASGVGSRAKPALYMGNTIMGSAGRVFAGAGSNSRGYSGGVSLLLATGHLCSFVVSPASAKNLQTAVLDPNTTNANASHNWQLDFKSYLNWFKTSDSAYQSLIDFTPTFVRPGTKFVSSGASTFPQSVSTTDAATTLSLTWSLVIEVPATGGSSGLPIPKYAMIQSLNKWQDTLYARPNVGGAGILGGGSGPMWQSLATLEATVNPLLAATYTTFFDTTYGYWSWNTSNTQRNVYATALALQTCLRWMNFGVGNADAQTMADQLAVVIANYQAQSGNLTGAIQKVRHTDTNNFFCQEGNHGANGDQPHIAMYSMAECLLAMIEYYRARGNQTLAATYGNITVAALLDAAMVWLVKVQQSDGGFLTEYSVNNTFTNANANGAAQYSASSSVDLAASMYRWAQLSPTATNAQKTQWQTQAVRATLYYMTSESVAHGNFEYGEGYDNYSHHGLKLLTRGFARMYKLLGSAAYLEHMAYYFEQTILLCKKVDEVVNNSASNNQDVHTGGLVSTINWSGVVSGEGAANWGLWMSEIAALHPGLLAHHYFYMWAALCNTTWGYRDAATYQASNALSYAYCTPGTNFAGNAQGLDNTKFLYFAPNAALLLLPTRTLVACDNPNVLSTCLEANFADTTPAGRTIQLYNPQGTSQAVNLTVRGMAGKNAQQDGVSIASTKSGADLAIGPLTLTAGQISRITVR